MYPVIDASPNANRKLLSANIGQVVLPSNSRTRRVYSAHLADFINTQNFKSMLNFINLKKSSFVFSMLFFGAFAFSKTDAEEPKPLQIDAIVSEIMAKNPEIKFYKEAVVGARSGVSLSSKLNDPELSIGGGYKRIPDSGRVSNGAVWQASITQVFEWPGRLSLRKAIAQRDVEMAKIGVMQFENALSAKAKTLAYGLYAANAKAAAIREVAQRFKSLRETFLMRDPAGISPLLETRVIESGELALQRRATLAELAVQSALIELNLLRGANVEAPIKVKAPNLEFREAPSIDGLLSSACNYNFEFKMRELELERQGFAVDLARNEQYPSIGVGPYVSHDGVDSETIVGLSLSIPLPITGRTSDVVNIAASKRRQAETALNVALRNLNRDVLIAAKAYATKLAELKKWSKDSVVKFREAAELADRNFRMGTIPISTYVELQNSYLDAVEAMLDTNSEILAAGMKLQEMTGVNLNPQTEEKK